MIQVFHVYDLTNIQLLDPFLCVLVSMVILILEVKERPMPMVKWKNGARTVLIYSFLSRAPKKSPLLTSIR